MAVSADYLAYVLDQLDPLGAVSSRRMFGGAGLYCEEHFFALIAADTLYLRVGDANRARFTTRGMAQFRPWPERPQLSMNYYEVPPEVLEDAAELSAWARESVAVAQVSPRPKLKPKTKKKTTGRIGAVRRRRS
jgi:DNA transformation protein and related proteins